MWPTAGRESSATLYVGRVVNVRGHRVCAVATHVEALKILGEGASKPLVVRLDGNNVLEGRRILDEANHPLVTQVDTMDNAAAKAAELAAGA